MKNFIAVVFAALASQISMASEPAGSGVRLPDGALSISGADWVRISEVESMIVPACDTCDGGTQVTIVTLEVTFNSCNSLLPVQTRVDYLPNEITIISVAAMQVQTKTSLVALCAAESSSVTVQVNPGINKKNIQLNTLKLSSSN